MLELSFESFSRTRDAQKQYEACRSYPRVLQERTKETGVGTGDIAVRFRRYIEDADRRFTLPETHLMCVSGTCRSSTLSELVFSVLQEAHQDGSSANTERRPARAIPVESPFLLRGRFTDSWGDRRSQHGNEQLLMPLVA